MVSATHGENTSTVEVTHVWAEGFWLFIDDREHSLSFEQFPWFRNAQLGQILKVDRPSENHLYWPELDIDLTVESIEHPDRYPLTAKS